jgi:nucleoside-diphosphate-sugar epimerase
MLEINVKGTRNLVQVLEEISSHTCLIFSSSQEAIGPQKQANIPANEDTPLRPTYFYGQTKVQAEEIISASTLSYFILRITGVTGPHDRYAAFQFIQAISLGIMVVYPGSCLGHTSFVHVQDVNELIRLIMIKKSEKYVDKQVYIVGPRDSLNYQQCIDIICDTCGWHRPWFHCPMWLFKFVVAIISPLINAIRSTIFNDKNSFLFNSKTLDCMDENRIYSSDKAIRELGYTPMTMRETLITSIKDHITNGDISYASVHKTRWLIGTVLTSAFAYMLYDYFC